jgi:hypothetical protein
MANGTDETAKRLIEELAQQSEPERTLFLIGDEAGFQLRPLPAPAVAP